MHTGHYNIHLPESPAAERVQGLIADGGVVLLDGGVATELQRVRADELARQPQPWGTWVLFQGPVEVLEVHRRYLRAGCDVISTNTWSVLEAADEFAPASIGGRNPLWLDAARMGVRLARQAIAEAGRTNEVAAAFCINSSLLDERASGRLELLSWAWNDEPPDMVILETLETTPDEKALDTIGMVCDTGLPVWVSFRRHREGMETVDGHILADADPAVFTETLSRLEDLGVRAVLVNCVPVDAVADTVAWLRQQTSLPVGCYPNLGHNAGQRWEFDVGVGADEYARLAQSWVAAGARIVGGCCGVTPEHLTGLHEALGPPAGSRTAAH